MTLKLVRYTNTQHIVLSNYKHTETINSPTGKEAKSVFSEAQELLKEIVHKQLFKASGVYGIFPAVSVQDDVCVLSPDGSGEIIGKLHGLRQQVGNKRY